MIFDFRLQVFQAVAQRLSFTKAAEALFITQPAITKHIRMLENQFNAKLFERRGNSIALTDAGQTLLKGTKELERVYANLEQAMHTLSGAEKGILRLGASTTIAQYVLPPMIAAFQHRFSDIELQVKSGNTQEIERLVVGADLDLGFIEGHTRNKQIYYEPFRQDEIVPVVRADHPLAAKQRLTVNDLTAMPLVMREAGSGTLEVVQLALKKAGLKWQQLSIAVQLDSTEAIKSYLLYSEGVAFISRFAIQREIEHGTLCVLKVQALPIARPLYLIHQQGEPPRLAGIFRKFALGHNRK